MHNYKYSSDHVVSLSVINSVKHSIKSSVRKLVNSSVTSLSLRRPAKVLTIALGMLSFITPIISLSHAQTNPSTNQQVSTLVHALKTANSSTSSSVSSTTSSSINKSNGTDQIAKGTSSSNLQTQSKTATSYSTKAMDHASANLVVDTSKLVKPTKNLSNSERQELLTKQQLSLLSYQFSALYDTSHPLAPITSNASFDEKKVSNEQLLTYAHPINFSIYRQEHPIVIKKTLGSCLKQLDTDIFGTIYNNTIVQGPQLPPLQFNNTLPNIFDVNYKYDRYLWNLFEKQGSVNFTINDIHIVLKQLGDQSFYLKFPDNLYVQAAQNVIAAIKSIAPINMDMSLRSQFKINKLVTQALQAYGLYNAQVTVEKTNKKELTVIVNPSKPVIMNGKSSIIIRGQGTGLPLYQDQSDSFINPQAVLSSTKYEQVKSNISNIALDNGFFDGKFVQHDLFINKDQNYAYWKLDFNTGVRYKINQITFTGSQINTNLLANAIDISKGQYYANTEITNSVAFLRSSQWFDGIAVDPKVNNQTKTVDLEYKVIPIRPNSLKLSFGYDTLEGFRTKSQFDRHYINSYGGSFQNTLYLSKIKQSLVLNYKHPNFFDPLQQFMNVGFSLNREYQPSFYNFARSLILYTNYTYVPHNNWQLSTTLSTRRDNWNYLDQSFRTALTYFDFNVARLSINTNFILNLKTSYAFSKLFDSSLNYNMISVKTGHMFNLNEDNAINVNIRLAKIFTNNFYLIPPTLRLYSGGATSIRGYSYNSVSNYNGISGIGGLASNDMQLEYLHKILLDGLKGVVFIDGGQTSNKIHFNNLDYGAGVGVRYYLPVGFVSFDIAYPLKPHFKWRNIWFYLGVTTQL